MPMKQSNAGVQKRSIDLGYPVADQGHQPGSPEVTLFDKLGEALLYLQEVGGLCDNIYDRVFLEQPPSPQPSTQAPLPESIIGRATMLAERLANAASFLKHIEARL